MHSRLSLPVLTWLVATAIAQTTTTPSTTTTGTAPYDYCTSTTSAEDSIFTPDANDVIPPIPCQGAYYVQEGFCCMGLNSTCVDGDCDCIDSDAWWQLPLDDCVQNNPQWSGCPGNMMKGLCCSGPDVALEGAELTPVCPTGTPVFTVRTTNGTTSTSTFPEASTTGMSITLLSSPTATSLTTSSSPGAAGRTAAPGEVLLAAMALAGAGGLVAAF